MSEALVRAALETQLATITPAIATAYENQAFTPPAASLPYQRVFLMLAAPWNPEMGSGHQIRGYLQVNLCWPQGVGSGAVEARALLIKNAFPKGASLVSGDVIVTIDGIVAKGNGSPDGTVFMMPVKVPFHANQFG